nr:putative ribonuclease H-like domain-containing protein [Tanacetum cinerariifolium]
MCDKKNRFLFTDSKCLVLSPDFKLPDESQVLLRVPRKNNMYNVNFKDIVPSRDLTYLFAKALIDESNLWHRRLGHVNFKTINKLVKGNIVRGLPTKVFENNNTCVACKKGKQHRASCKAKPVSSVNQPLFRLHIDLFGPTFIKSLNKKSYCLVITDDYSRFTWVFFLATKDETSPILKTFITSLENQLSLKVKVIRSDNGTKFKNSDLNQFCELKGIKREFSIPRIPQQNGIAERKNRTLIEAARTMLADSLLPIPFWADAVNTACYVQNRVLVTKPHNKTPYELLHGRTPSIGFMRPFGCPVTILNTLDPLGKFERKADEGFLVGYSVNSKAFRVFNSRTCIVQETLHVIFLENKPTITGTGPTWLFDIDSLTRTMNYQPVIAGNQSNLSAGFQDEFDAEKAGEEATQQYMLFPVWSTGSLNPQNKEGDDAFDGKEHDAEKPESVVNLSPSSSALSGEQDDMTKKQDKGKSHVEYFIGNRDFNVDFEDYSENSNNNVSAAGPIVPTAGQSYSNSTNPISAAGPSNTNTSPTHGKSILQDASQRQEMLEKEDIAYSDHENVGAEADFNNLETSITISPIPTTRTHKDHPVSQIIGFEDPDHPDKVYKVVKTLYGLHQAPRSCKSDASERFNQIINFLNGSYIEYALTVNPTIYVSCIKQFWNTVAIKQSNDVTRLQALVDKKKVVVTKAAIKDALYLDDAEGVDCLPNEEIFTALARMGYEKPSTKLTFYKAFFSSQWKFLIHTILQSLSAKHTSWNEFSSGDVEEQSNDDNAAEEPITAISKDDVEDQSIPSPTLPTSPPQQPQDMPSTSQAQSPPPHPQSLTLAQPQGADFPMSLLQEALDICAALTRRVKHLEHDKVAQNLEITKLKIRVKKLERANNVKTLKLRRLRKVGTSQRVNTSDDTVIEDVSNQGRMIDELNKDEGAVLMSEKEEKETKEVKDITGDAQVEGRQVEIYQIDMDHAATVLSMQEDEPEIQEAVEVVTTAKLITEVVTTISETVNATAGVPAGTVTPAPVKVVVPSTRRRGGVVIRDPKEESCVKTPTKTKSKDKGKGIMVEEPKPIKKKQQVELDEAYARKLQEELNQDINWEVTIDHVKQKAKESPYVQRYQVMKKRPQTEAQARRNMMVYLKNTVGFRLDYFKGMSYDDIHPIFEAKFNSNIEFMYTQRLLHLLESAAEKNDAAKSS